MVWFFRSYAKILLGLMSIVSSMSFGYPTPMDFNGQLSRWNIDKSTPSVYFFIKGDDLNEIDRYSGLVEEAAALWTNASESYLVLEKSEEKLDTGIIINLDSYGDSGVNAAGFSQVESYDDKGYMKTCLINISLNKNPTITILSKTILHEIGHCIGLGHSVVPRSIMSYHLDENSFELNVDDEAAIASLYPIEGDEPVPPLGCAVNASPNNTRKLGLIILLVLPFIVVSIRRLTPSLRRSYMLLWENY